MYQENLMSLKSWKFPSRGIFVFDLGCFRAPVSAVTRGTSPPWEHHFEAFGSFEDHLPAYTQPVFQEGGAASLYHLAPQALAGLLCAYSILFAEPLPKL